MTEFILKKIGVTFQSYYSLISNMKDFLKEFQECIFQSYYSLISN